ncbi:hypothetical protein FQN60_015598, partial [Etheostoma spectabile]
MEEEVITQLGFDGCKEGEESDVVKVDVAVLVKLRGNNDDATGSRGLQEVQQEVSEEEVTQVIHTELHLKPILCLSRSEVQVFDDHLPLLWSRLFLDVLGCLLGAPLVPAGHDDPGMELQQLPGQGLPYPAVSPGHDDCLSSHSVARIPEQLLGFLPGEQPTHEEQYPAADNSGYYHRNGHESRIRRFSFFSGNGIKEMYIFLFIFILGVIPSICQAKPSKISCFLHKKDQTSEGSPDHITCKWEHQAVNEITSEWVLNKTLKEKEHGKVTIEKVESCSNYTFAVRCALDKAPWSDWSQKKVLTTKLNKRDVKLRLWRKISELGKSGLRKVHAMWTEIPSTCQDIFTYTIKQTPYKEHKMGVNFTDTLCGKSTCDVDVSQDAHRIHLIVHNEALLVEFKDSVYVPAIGESLPQVTDIQTSTREGVVLVSWKAPSTPVSGYMIDWTHNGNQYQWKESNDTNTTLSDLLDKKPYNITVTPLLDDKTGHGTQALQICSRVADPGNITIRVQANDKSALVSWHVNSQEACSGAAVNYTVFYRTQDGGPQLNVTVDGKERVISLKDLTPDTQYSVYVKATALTGTTKSSENSFKTKRFGLGLIIIKFREKPVPNPGNSSVALWPALSRQEPFSNPTESLCDRVYTEETQRMSISPLATGCNGNLMSDQTDEYVDPGTVQAPDEQNEDPVNHAERQHLSSPDDSTALLPSETSPYRSQTSVESPASKPINQCKRVPVKQPEKTALVTVYVTLDMFDQGQG